MSPPPPESKDQNVCTLRYFNTMSKFGKAERFPITPVQKQPKFTGSMIPKNNLRSSTGDVNVFDNNAFDTPSRVVSKSDAGHTPHPSSVGNTPQAIDQLKVRFFPSISPLLIA